MGNDNTFALIFNRAYIRYYNFAIFVKNLHSLGKLPTHIYSTINIPIAIVVFYLHHTTLAIGFWFAVLLATSEEPCCVCYAICIVRICILKLFEQLRRTMLLQEIIILIEFTLIHPSDKRSNVIFLIFILCTYIAKHSC